MKQTLKQHALSLSVSSFAIGTICAAFALIGYFDNRIQYCDALTNPCTQVTVPTWYSTPPLTAKYQKSISGRGLVRTASGIGAILFGGVAFVLSGVAAKKQLEIDARSHHHSSLENKRLSIIEGEEAQKIEIAADYRVKDFQKQLIDGYAQLHLEENPELLEAYLQSANNVNNDNHDNQSIEDSAPNPVDFEVSDTPPPNQPDEVQPNSVVPPPSDTNNPTLEPLDRILGAKRSTLIVGGTGAGKSVTESYMLTKFFQRYPEALVWAIAQKNDSFCGLDKKGRVLLFDPLEPQATFKAIDEVYNIYDQRRRTPERWRHEFDNQPVRLILADWHSIYETCKDEAWFAPYLKKISTIITVGRELNVCLIIDTQSFNLAALGIGDSNIRKNLYIIAQGNYNVEPDGTINDSYGVLYNLITNAKIIEDAEIRLQLKTRFNDLKPQSRQLGQPLIFISVDPMQLDILPDITNYKPGQKPAITLDTVSPEYLETLLRLEFDVDIPSPHIADKVHSVAPLSDIQIKIIDYLKGKDAKTPRQIKQNAAAKFKGISEQLLRDELIKLVELEKVTHCGDDCYKLID